MYVNALLVSIHVLKVTQDVQYHSFHLETDAVDSREHQMQMLEMG